MDRSSTTPTSRMGTDMRHVQGMDIDIDIYMDTDTDTDRDMDSIDF
jgi:hypothetical protein